MICQARSSVMAASSWALKISTASQRAWYSARAASFSFEGSESEPMLGSIRWTHIHVTCQLDDNADECRIFCERSCWFLLPPCTHQSGTEVIVRDPSYRSLSRSPSGGPKSGLPGGGPPRNGERS